MAEPNIAGGVVGGLLIGLASLLLLAGSGQLAGISGILGGLYGKWTDSDLKWRLTFLAGLIVGAGLVAFLQGGMQQTLQAQGRLLILAGLLVGVGTRLGGGCTSGHGICGLAQRAKRSIVATLLFMGSAMVTVYLIRHVLS